TGLMLLFSKKDPKKGFPKNLQQRVKMFSDTLLEPYTRLSAFLRDLRGECFPGLYGDTSQVRVIVMN
ncbi:MAG: hypothetical protein P1S46_04020, partial [bacterium]|nr:hypothetical protein [bacterium]